MPDRTILLEIGADDAVGRMGGERDRIEREDDDFHARAAARLPAAGRRAFPTGIVVLDGTRGYRRRELAEEDPWSPFVATFPSSPRRSGCSTAALAEGDAHAFLFHGPAGVGKTSAAFAFAGALLGDARRVVERDAPRSPACVEPLGEMIRIDDDPRAPPRPAPAAVRGRPPRVPPARRAPAQRRRRRRAAQGPRGAAALRDDRARRRRARADARRRSARAASSSRSGGCPSAPCATGSTSTRRSSARSRRPRSRGSPAAGSTGPAG